MSDPYKVLGIDRNATDDEVKTAYRKLSRKYHPDANVNNPNKDKAEEMFKLVQQAYDQIMNERKHGGYTSGGFGSNGTYGGFGDFGSFNGNTGYSQDNSYYTAAANYINNARYHEALNVLNNISDRNAQWYFLSALANNGVGNNILALDMAKLLCVWSLITLLISALSKLLRVAANGTMRDNIHMVATETVCSVVQTLAPHYAC